MLELPYSFVAVLAEDEVAMTYTGRGNTREEAIQDAIDNYES